MEQGKPVQFFKYEMQILNYSKTLTKQDRCQRFNELINMDYTSQQEDGMQNDVVASGQLIGAGLIWARAQFDKKPNDPVQINTWVKITVELFTRLKQGIELESIQAKFNESKFDFKTTQHTILTRDKPIVLEEDIYLNEETFNNGCELFVLNQFVLKLKDKPLKFSIQPYLTAKDKIRGKMDKKGAGLKQPVMITIAEMPPKLTFDIKTEWF